MRYYLAIRNFKGQNAIFSFKDEVSLLLAIWEFDELGVELALSYEEVS